jgi:hypothetical protein
MARRRARHEVIVLPEWVNHFVEAEHVGVSRFERARSWRDSVRTFCQGERIAARDLSLWLRVNVNVFETLRDCRPHDEDENFIDGASRSPS